MFSGLGPDFQTETCRYNNNNNNKFCFTSYGVWECLTINTDFDSGNSYCTSG